MRVPTYFLKYTQDCFVEVKFDLMDLLLGSTFVHIGFFIHYIFPKNHIDKKSTSFIKLTVLGLTKLGYHGTSWKRTKSETNVFLIGFTQKPHILLASTRSNSDLWFLRFFLGHNKFDLQAPILVKNKRTLLTFF